MLDPPPLRTRALEGGADDGDEGVAFAASLLLYLQLIVYGLAVASGVVEEKSSRVVEVLLASIPPRSLLAGKIAGIGLLGLLQLLLTAVVGLGLASASGAIDLDAADAGVLAVVLVWFLLGYLLWACLYAMAGAIVSRQEDLQSSTTVLTLVLVVSYLVAFPALDDPESTIAVVASLVPLSSPIIMPVRVAVDAASTVEIVASLGLLVVGIALLVPLGARIYENAVLRMGKPLKLREAWNASAPVAVRKGALLAAGVAVLAGTLAGPAGAAEPGCDPIDPAQCLLPWPNDHFTVRDHGTPTGRRVQLDVGSMPTNASGVPIEPSDYNRADGFSPGALIVTKVPGLDTPEAFARSGAVPITDIGRSFDAPPAGGGDSRAQRPQAADLVRARLQRDLAREHGAADPPGPEPARGGALHRCAAQAARSGRRAARAQPGVSPLPRSNRHRLRGVRAPPAATWSASSGACGGPASGAVASTGPGTSRWRARTGSRAACATSATRPSAGSAIGAWVTCAWTGRRLPSRSSGSRSSPPVAPTAARPARTRTSGAGWRGRWRCPVTSTSRAVQPARASPSARTACLGALAGNVHRAGFICNIPRSVSSSNPGRMSLYGHGLFGSAREVNSISRGPIATEYGVILCATDWIGMSGGDLANTASILGELSRFPTLADRLQQAMLNFLFLGRAMIHPQGFSSSLAFWDSGGPLIDADELYYSGGSQGGIAGGALTAVAPDFRRSVLIVPAMNYSLLLTRSIDFDPFAALMYPAYPNELERPLLLRWSRCSGIEASRTATRST